MGLMDKIFGKKGNVLDTLEETELKREQITLKNRSERLRQEIHKLEAQKSKIFNQGVGADNMKKNMLAQEMQTLEMEIKTKYKIFRREQKQHRIISNLVVIKKNQAELQRQGVWNQLLGMDQEKLEIALSEIALNEETFTTQLDTIMSHLDSLDDVMTYEEDEDTKKLMEAWAVAETEGIETAEEMIGLETSVREKNKKLERDR